MSKLFDAIEVTDEIKRFVDNSIDVADQIHAILERQGKSQRDLASMLEKNESEVSKWLTGTHNFTLKSISKIETVLGEKIITTPVSAQQQFRQAVEKAVLIAKMEDTLHQAVKRVVKKAKFVSITQVAHYTQSDLYVENEINIPQVA